MSKFKSLRIGIIGLGIMGSSMARALLAAGHQVLGYDVNAAKVRALRRAGVTPILKLSELASQADFLITSLPSADALHEVVNALESTKSPKRGQILLETSTLPLADKLRADTALRKQGRVLLDAPISGTATNKPADIWIMYLSGPVVACRQVKSWPQVSAVEKYHIPYALIMGKKEAVEKTIIVRNNDTHAQEIVNLDDLPKYMKKLEK